MEATYRASVVIPTIDDERVFLLLEDLEKQVPGHDIETLVIWNGRNPAFWRRLQEVIETIPNARCLRSPERSIARARNLGIEASRSERIVWLDADCRLGADYVARVLEQAERSALFRGQVRFRGNGSRASKLEARLRDIFYHRLYRGKCLTPNLVIDKALYREFGGFLSECGDDMVWSEESGQAPELIVDDAEVTHLVSGQLRDIMRSWFKYGLGAGWREMQRRRRTGRTLAYPSDLATCHGLFRRDNGLELNAFIVLFCLVYATGLFLAPLMRDRFIIAQPGAAVADGIGDAPG